MQVDIEQFYEEDPRRRASEESEFGRDWHDGDGVRYEISWVRDTGELYAMSEPAGSIISDGLGDENIVPMAANLVLVEVLGTIDAAEEVQQVLSGWPEAMTGPDSLAWVRDRLTQGTGGPGASSASVPTGERPEQLPGAGT
ncbi:MAG: hypothetical protein ACXW1M_04105 [Acidimicrobiia bacterium]